MRVPKHWKRSSQKMCLFAHVSGDGGGDTGREELVNISPNKSEIMTQARYAPSLVIPGMM